MASTKQHRKGVLRRTLVKATLEVVTNDQDWLWLNWRVEGAALPEVHRRAVPVDKRAITDAELETMADGACADLCRVVMGTLRTEALPFP